MKETLLWMNINNSCALIFWEHSLFSSFYCDYFAQSSGTHYSIRGGSSANGLRCGVFFVYLDYTSGATAWGLGAALSFKSLFYCDYFYQSSNVNCAIRGGSSGSGFGCGIFYVNVSNYFGYTRWYIGAALSFKQKK